MKLHRRIAIPWQTLGGVFAALALQPVAAGDANGLEEIVVYGRRSVLEIDTTAMRIDLAACSKWLEISVRAALAEAQRETRDVQVVSLDTKPRG